eukprot:50994-Pyramimonas_sp.AAC.1
MIISPPRERGRESGHRRQHLHQHRLSHAFTVIVVAAAAASLSKARRATAGVRFAEAANGTHPRLDLK